VRARVHAGEHEVAGVAGPDESWAVAAARIAGGLSPTAALHLWPHDLSVGTAHFVVDRDLVLDLRAMTRGDLPDLADINGQESAKRALEVAAAGSHNLLMVGPPGSGKSMLAQRLASILPPLGPRELLEL